MDDAVGSFKGQAGRTVKTAAPTLASVTPMPAPRATNTVRVLSSGIDGPPSSLATAHGTLNEYYRLPGRGAGDLDLAPADARVRDLLPAA